jgi:coenzyme PQQ precursor peptide PqqA
MHPGGGPPRTVAAVAVAHRAPIAMRGVIPMVPMSASPGTPENGAVRQSQPSTDRPPVLDAWVRPDFEAYDTALEVTAYAARD